MFALLVGLTVAGTAATVFDDHSSFLGSGTGRVCAEPQVTFGGGEYDKALAPYREMLNREVVAPDAAVTVAGLRVCDHTPATAQRVLDSLTQAPEFLLYFAVFFLFFRLLRAAESDGPFSPLVAGRLRTTGWTLIVGGYLAHAIQNAARTALENTFAVPDGMLHYGSGFVVAKGVFTLPLTDLLTGLGLLTVARILRVGARMRDEPAGAI